MPYGFTIGERLKELRDEKNEKQQDVASAICVDRTVISFYERNERKPDADKLIALANHFGVTTDFLLCLSDVKKSDTTLQAVSKYIGLSDEAIRKIRLSKNALENKELFDEFICSPAFSQMLSAFDYAIDTIRYFCIEMEHIEEEIDTAEKNIEHLKKEEGYDDEELEYDYSEMKEAEIEIENLEMAIDEQIDVCSVKMLKVVRKFLEEKFRAE